jgi:hypothetical protein
VVVRAGVCRGTEARERVIVGDASAVWDQQAPEDEEDELRSSEPLETPAKSSMTIFPGSPVPSVTIGDSACSLLIANSNRNFNINETGNRITT